VTTCPKRDQSKNRKKNYFCYKKYKIESLEFLVWRQMINRFGILSDKIFNFTKFFALTILRVEFGHFYSGQAREL
jgi:hypothetical protein